jgi:hypothetical protein
VVDDIVVTTSDYDNIYRYKLIDTDDGSSVDAKLLG